MIDTSDMVRDLENVHAADPRMQHTNLGHRLAHIAEFSLSSKVPEDIRIHFETGKNLYVYAWHVYRFHTVAEQHVLATLEMAVGLRLSTCRTPPLPRGLSRLLYAARDSKLIANDRFTNRYQWAFQRAKWRHDVAEMERMNKEGIGESVVDYSNVRPNEEELQYDWLESFIVALPKVRNMHAHGSTALYPAVLATFEIVVELINQLFPDEHTLTVHLK